MGQEINIAFKTIIYMCVKLASVSKFCGGGDATFLIMKNADDKLEM
jgi:hypothetical protein